MANLKINIGDTWKDVAETKINVGDTWKTVSAAKINIGDVWKDVLLSSGWDVSTATYDNKSKDVSSQCGRSEGLFFKSDGSKMYIMAEGDDTVHQYTLSTPWDVSTATYDNKSKSVHTQDITPRDVFFKSDGSKMYIVGDYNNTVYQYTLSTPWDVSTATYDNKSKKVEGTNPSDVFFKSDGSKMYTVGTNYHTVHQYTLSTPWDVSTATYDNKSKNVGSEDGIPKGLFFKSDGSKMYIAGDYNNTVYQYTLSTPWDVSTATYDNKNKDVSGQDTSLTGLFFKSDGSKMYITEYDYNIVYQYSLS